MSDCEQCGSELCDTCGKPTGGNGEMIGCPYFGYSCRTILCADCERLGADDAVHKARGCKERFEQQKLATYQRTEDSEIAARCADFTYDCGINKGQNTAASFSKGDDTVHFWVSSRTLAKLNSADISPITLGDCSKLEHLEMIR